jgi:2-iminobutanoate/2-iminopropanoate deaminase
MKRELIRVEPYSTNFEKWKAPVSCSVFCTSPDYFAPFNEIYKKYFREGNQPARIFTIVPLWTGPFDVEIDCVAVARD